MGRMPSAVGYQPTLANEMGALAGAHHLHQERLHHLGAGGVRPRRRPDRPGPRHHLRPPGRHHRAVPEDRGAGHLSRRGPAGVHLPHSWSPTWWASATTRWPGRCRSCSSATGSCRTSSPSWAWRSSPTEDKLTVEPGPQDPAVLLPALLCGPDLHRHGGPLCAAWRRLSSGFEAILGGELDNVSEVCFNNMGTIDEVWQKSKEEA